MAFLLEEYEEKIDIINDLLTDMTDDVFEGSDAVEAVMISVNSLLEKHDLRLDFDDIEDLVNEWDEPDEYEAVNIMIPVYTIDNDDSDLSISLTYAFDDIETNTYTVDIELQYSWEDDEEDEDR